MLSFQSEGPYFQSGNDPENLPQALTEGSPVLGESVIHPDLDQEGFFRTMAVQYHCIIGNQSLKGCGELQKSFCQLTKSSSKF